MTVAPSDFTPAPRRLVAAFPASLASSMRADRMAEERRQRELAMGHDVLRAYGGGAVCGGFSGRVINAAARFDPVKIAGSVLDLDPSNVGSQALASAYLIATDFTVANWTKTGLSVTANNATAPDGSNTAFLLTGTGAGMGTYQQVAAVQYGNLMLSLRFVFYAKYVNTQWICLLTDSTAAASARAVFFDIQNGAMGVIGTNHSGATITAVGGGWYRCEATRVQGTNVPFHSLYLSSTDTNLVTPANGSAWHAWGPDATQVRSSTIANLATGALFSQATVNNQLGVSEINGVAAFRGKGAQRAHSTEAALIAALSASCPHTVFIVPKPEVLDIASAIIGVGHSTVASNSTRYWGTSTTGLGRYRYQSISDVSEATNRSTDTGADNANGVASVVEFWSDGSLASILTNGTTPSVSAAAHGITLLTIDNVAIFARPDSVPDSHFTGYLGRATAHSRPLSVAERSYIRMGLGAQYAVAVTP